jgi:hypothetical protein
MRPGQPEYKGAKADPLDNPFYFDAYSIDSHIYSGKGKGKGKGKNSR